MFKVNNKDTRTTSLTSFWCLYCFYCYFEHVISGWIGAVAETDTYMIQYVKDFFNHWNIQLKLLSTIAENQPQAAYLTFVSGFKSKLNYFMRTIPEISCHLVP